MNRNEQKKSEGRAEKTGGMIRRFFGRLFGDRVMAAEGQAKEIRGQERIETGKAGERTKGKIEEVAGAVENRVGHLIGDDKGVYDGRAQELRGQRRQDANR